MSVPVSEQTLIVRNFGPIESCELVVKPILCFIGPQASGKSTLSKLIYFFQNLRTELVGFLLQGLDRNERQVNQVGITKLIREVFEATFGPVRPRPNTLIEFRYNADAVIVFKQDNPANPYFDPLLSEFIKRELDATVTECHEMFPIDQRGFTQLDGLAAKRLKLEKRRLHVNTRLRAILSVQQDQLFVPAGRSLVSILSEQLQSADTKHLEGPMQVFIRQVNGVKSTFTASLEDIWVRFQATHLVFGPDPVVQDVIRVIGAILKGSYEQDGSTGRIHIAPNESVKINFASSGQQESLWLLLWLFWSAMQGSPDHLFLEEPEAHLFPDAQRQLVELFVRMHNELGCQFTITTHSPYILSSLNNLLDAYRVGQKHPEQAAEVVAKEYWLDPSHAGGLFMTHAGMEPLLDPELGIYKVELIDSVSRKLAEDYDRLASIEFSGQGDDGAA